VVVRKSRGTTPEIIAEAKEILGDLARLNEPLGEKTTYRVGGAAALYVLIDSDLALERVVDAVSATGIKVLVFGKGSNLLIADRGFGGLVVSLGGTFGQIDIDHERASVDAGGGVSYPVLARQTAAAGLTGMEWAVGIPGTVGGAVAMNAGGHGSDTADRLVCARIVGLFDRTNRILTPRELDLAYRSSVLTPSDLVLSATYFLDAGDAEAAMEEIDTIVRWRREHQPGGRNAGSVFTNPVGDSAGRIIDAVGLKGLRIGSAEVSEKHANFIQLDENGSANDAYRLIKEVQRVVEERTGVTLRPEVRFVGFES
jgi:UDP-N-acetylmuramate dehydrogenase